MRSSFPTLLPLFVIFVVILSRRPVHMLRRRGAISAETAQPLADLKGGDRRRLANLIRRGVVREVTPGQYYYDVAAERAQRQAMMPWLIGLVIVLGLVAVGLWYFNQSQVRPLP